MVDKKIEDMSDEELMSLQSAPEVDPEEDPAPTTEDQEEVDTGDDDDQEQEDADGSDDDDDQNDASDAFSTADVDDDDDSDAADSSESDNEDSESTDSPTGEDGGDNEKLDGEKDASKETSAEELDYKAAYERLTAPFRANGKEMKVDNVDDAITLMQMGANYNKKMAALKPNLKLIKMLENHELLSEEKLSYLIDLSKKNPAAIQKLLKDSGIDPLEMNEAEEKSEYKPGTYTVADKEIELEEVLDRLQDTPTYHKTLDVVSNKWDGPSKQAIAEAPQILEVINDHIARGVYDVIIPEVERERALGRLNGLSNLQAYQQVGAAIHERNGFDHLKQTASEPSPPPRREVKPTGKSADSARNDKRRAASPTRSGAPSAKPAGDFNPLAMSDEEFEKQANARLI